MKDEKKNKPFFFDTGNGENEEQKSTAQKISETKQKNSDEALELDAAPFTELTTRDFQPLPEHTLQIVSRSEVKNAQDFDLKSLQAFVVATNSAFVCRTISGKTFLVPTLSSAETRTSVWLLSEFVSQSNSWQEDMTKRKAVKDALAKEKSDARIWNNRHKKDKDFVPMTVEDKIELPLVKIGQNADDLDDVVKERLLTRYGVNFADIYRSGDTVFDPHTWKEVERDESKWPHGNGDEILCFTHDKENLLVNSFEIIQDVETWHCEDVKTHELKDVLKYKAQKFIFLNLSDFYLKYAHKELKGAEFKQCFDGIENLGKKNVPVISDDGVSVSQFFTMYRNCAKHGRKYYTLLVLNTPEIFKGIENGGNFLKLSAHFEDILQNASSVKTRLYLDAACWTKDIEVWNKKAKRDSEKVLSCDKDFSCRTLFETYASASELDNRRFSSFWETFRSAALELLGENIFLYVRLNGKKMTRDAKAKETDKVTFGVNLDVFKKRQAPKLSDGEQNTEK